MSQRGLIDKLLAEEDPVAQRTILEKHAPLLDDQFADALKVEADRLLRVDIQHCLQVCDLLIYEAELIQIPLHRALGLLAKANAHAIGLAEHERALELYDEAAAIYQRHSSLVDQAKSQIGKLWALASLGRYEEVTKVGEWAGQVLESQEQWFLLVC